jgi:hypothetical protein
LPQTHVIFHHSRPSVSRISSQKDVFPELDAPVFPTGAVVEGVGGEETGKARAQAGHFSGGLPPAITGVRTPHSQIKLVCISRRLKNRWLFF